MLMTLLNMPRRKTNDGVQAITIATLEDVYSVCIARSLNR